MRIGAGGCLALIATTLNAATFGPGIVTVSSRSGQFVVRGTRPQAMITGPGIARFPPSNFSPTNLVTLDPDLLAVSAERIKQNLLRELSLPDQWRGKVLVDLHPAAAGEEPAFLLTSLYSPNGWQYHLDLPDRLTAQKAARAIVELSLLEIANRNAGSRSAELPPWLIEGLTQHLLHSAQADLILRPEMDLVRQLVRPDPLATVREVLRTHRALTFTELSLPSPAELTGDGWTAYQASAQLLVTDLFRLRTGRSSVANLLVLLPNYLNWQSAFLQAFQPTFRTLLDAEKWWALSVSRLAGRDTTLAWSTERSLQKLEAILGLPVLVRYASNSLPVTTNLPLQTIIGQWDFAHQRNILVTKTNLLQALRPNLPIALLPLLDAYHSTLATYLAKSDRAAAAATTRYLPAVRPQVLRRDVIRQLDSLDARREQMQRASASATNAPSALNTGQARQLGQLP